MISCNIYFFARAFFIFFFILFISSISLSNVTFKPGILVQEDSVFFYGNDKDSREFGNLYPSGSSLRRANLSVNGNLGKLINGQISYFTQFDFSQTDRSPTRVSQAYIKYTLDKISVRIGQINNIMGMELNSGSSKSMFMENSSPTDAFLSKEYFGLNLNIIHSPGCVFSFAALYPDLSKKLGEDDNDKLSFMARCFFVPYVDFMSTLHFGVNFQYSDCYNIPYIVDSGMEIRGRDFSVDKTQRLINTGMKKIAIKNKSLVLEMSTNYHAITMQGEYFFDIVDWDPPIESGEYKGWYAQIGYLVTGEKRNYNNIKGIFEDPVSLSPIGAIELAFRYSNVDLRIPDDNVAFSETGLTNTWVAGINWFVNQNFKVQLNFTGTFFKFNDIENIVDRRVSAIGTRIQFTA